MELTFKEMKKKNQNETNKLTTWVMLVKLKPQNKIHTISKYWKESMKNPPLSHRWPRWPNKRQTNPTKITKKEVRMILKYRGYNNPQRYVNR